MIASKQYCGVSNGSACTSKSYTPSYVLLAMGIPVSDIENSIRISWGPDTEVDVFKAEFEKLINVAKSLAGYKLSSNSYYSYLYSRIYFYDYAIFDNINKDFRSKTI